MACEGVLGSTAGLRVAVGQGRGPLIHRTPLWCADFTYLRCWEGPVFFAFVIDSYSRMIVGWQFADHMRTDLVLDALRTALHLRGLGADVELVHHSDAGSPVHLLRLQPDAG